MRQTSDAIAASRKKVEAECRADLEAIRKLGLKERREVAKHITEHCGSRKKIMFALLDYDEKRPDPKKAATINRLFWSAAEPEKAFPENQPQRDPDAD